MNNDNRQLHIDESVYHEPGGKTLQYCILYNN